MKTSVFVNKNEIKFSSERRTKLKFIIEDFLDRDWSEILEDKKNDKLNIRSMIINIAEGILLPPRYYEDELEEQNIPDMEDGEYSPNTTDDDRIKPLFILHRNLKPLWNELKKKICDYKWPQKEPTKKKVKTKSSNQPVTDKRVLNCNPNNNEFESKGNSIDNTIINFSEFENLASEQSEIDKLDNFKDIIISKARPVIRDRNNKFSSIKIKVNFNGGEINLIREDVDLVNNFIGYLEGTPINVFAKCAKCGKFIIVTRSDRECCSTLCASGRHQKEKWEKISKERKISNKNH